MPALGLPKTVSGILSAILLDYSVISWKVAAENDKPVVVLRFGTSTQQDGEPVINTGTWRRKAPSQIRRDQQRTKQKYKVNDQRTYSRSRGEMPVKFHREEKEETTKASDSFNNVSSSPSGLFLPSPEMTRTDIHTEHSFAIDSPSARKPLTPPAAMPAIEMSDLHEMSYSDDSAHADTDTDSTQSKTYQTQAVCCFDGDPVPLSCTKSNVVSSDAEGAIGHDLPTDNTHDKDTEQDDFIKLFYSQKQVNSMLATLNSKLDTMGKAFDGHRRGGDPDDINGRHPTGIGPRNQTRGRDSENML